MQNDNAKLKNYSFRAWRKFCPNSGRGERSCLPAGRKKLRAVVGPRPSGRGVVDSNFSEPRPGIFQNFMPARAFFWFSFVAAKEN
ncbi:MAG: hypothetical protein LiPW39_22 [Parcubacteria group bacterium LiPW_39]|nr:MAG: hypothetical protein LiPW39_22 [Parcubacteria group bacterium LiPW_39]